MEPPPPSLLPPEGKHLAAFFESCLNRAKSLQIRAPAIIFYYAAPAASRRRCRGQQALPVPPDLRGRRGLPDHPRPAAGLAGLSLQPAQQGPPRPSLIQGLCGSRTLERSGFGMSAAAAVRPGPAPRSGGQAGKLASGQAGYICEGLGSVVPCRIEPQEGASAR